MASETARSTSDDPKKTRDSMRGFLWPETW
jgi:hypothetical protein